MAATRREQLRRETLRDITATALEHLRRHGAADLSLRAIARDLGMSAAGLYRYFDGRDALLTQLITDGYHDLADAILVATGAPAEDLFDAERRPADPPFGVAADAPLGERYRAAAGAYRWWARGHPHEFALLYGTPVPGYAAPESGETTAANIRVGVALGQPIVELALTGRLTPLPHTGAPALAGAVKPMLELLPPLADAPAVAATLLLSWARLHGAVTLEINGQFDFLFGDDAAPLYETVVANLADDLGFTVSHG